MLNIFKKPIMIYSLVIGIVVDTFGLIQILFQKQLNMKDLISSPWPWLMLVVSFAVVAVYFYFRWQNYKVSVTMRITALENELKEYRKGVNKEFCQAYSQINGNSENINKLTWQFQRHEEIQNLNPNNALFRVEG